MTDAENRAAITDVLVRYATAIDRRDWDLFRTCFTADVRGDYGEVGRWDGIDDLTEFMADVHAGMGSTLHRLSNFAIALEHDTATARTYVDVVLTFGDGSVHHEVGYYDDELVRSGDEWRIERRRFTSVAARPF